MDDGSLRVWGVGDDGQLGIGDSQDMPAPEILSSEFFDSEVVSVGCGFCHTWAVTALGSLYQWGEINGSSTPKKNTVKVRLLWAEEMWKKAARWLFLGRTDEESIFSVLHVEVVFHFSGVVNRLDKFA
jgi:hypothetical protein